MVAVITHTFGIMQIMKRKQAIVTAYIKLPIDVTMLNLKEAQFKTITDRMQLKNNRS